MSKLGRIVQCVPGFRRSIAIYVTGTLETTIKNRTRAATYSPLPDISEVQSQAPVLFPGGADVGPSIDLKPALQRLLLTELARYHSDFHWPETPAKDCRFHLQRTLFTILFNSFVGHTFKEFIESNMPMFLRNTGGSLWLRKTF